VDAAYYEDLAGRLYGLLIMLEDRLGGEQAQVCHHFIEVGEYGLALEEIAGALAQDTIAITDQERGDMRAGSSTSSSRQSARDGLPESAHAAYDALLSRASSVCTASTGSSPARTRTWRPAGPCWTGPIICSPSGTASQPADTAAPPTW
jgi:hypothetical protein